MSTRPVGRAIWVTFSLSIGVLGASRAHAAPAAPAPAAALPPDQAALGENGQLSSKFMINDADPESSIPDDKVKNANPMEFGYLLQDLLVRAEDAKKKKDFQAVIRYYRAVAKGVPDRAKGWGKLCEAYDVVHDRDRAIRACKYAIERDGAEAGDFVRYVGLIVSKPDDLTADEKKELSAVLGHLEKDPTVGVTFHHLQCQVGVKERDAVMLEACTSALEKVAPDDPKTVIFKWSLAVMKGKTDEANRLVDRARDLGVLAEAVERMQNLTTPGGRRHWAAWGAAGACAGLAIASALLWFTRKTRRLARAA
jgi:hypothetical protein